METQNRERERPGMTLADWAKSRLSFPFLLNSDTTVEVEKEEQSLQSIVILNVVKDLL